MIAIVRQLLVVVCMVIVSAVIVEAAAPAPDLAMLVEEAYQNNQELLSMTENAQALRAEAPFAGSLQDPVVGVSVANLPVDSFAFDQEPMTQKQLFASQKFPWFGTLDLRQQVSQLKAMEAEYQVRSRKLEIAKELAGAWYDLGYTIKSLEINEKLKALVTQMLRVAETRYATGEGLQQDILAGQVQHSELLDEGVNLASREQVIRTQIGSLLNRGQFFDHIGPLALDEPGKIPDRGLLNRAALQSNPLVQQKKVARDRAKVEVQLAEKAYLPDFNVQLSYGQREDRPDFLSASVAMTVPLWQSTSQDSKLAAAKKRFAAAQKSLLGLSQTLPQSIDRVLAEIAGARENYSLFNEALSVQAAQLADASLAAYSVGKVEFNTMLAARIRLMRFQLKAENYKSQIYKKQAELEEIVGTRLSSLEGVQ
ncbi:TolC family protein [Desulfopila sp. IMCC35006]|uniref:TolC family protein n=1 Tax=Desulfopila sp. IMCC35006 TaxID=2569542 RepID=UPI0010AC6487|nr:TolC family protein [Desulfopila sp. IMCC35006]TKB28076.1 TolC family protein [Desulfopila sp. IMCC35006]